MAKGETTILLARAIVEVEDLRALRSKFVQLEQTWRDHGEHLKGAGTFGEKVAGNWYIDRANELQELLKGVTDAHA